MYYINAKHHTHYLSQTVDSATTRGQLLDLLERYHYSFGEGWKVWFTFSPYGKI